MQTYVDSNSPRHRLPSTELPRGQVRFPEHIVEGVAKLAMKYGYGEDYARQSLVRNTLAWFYEGLPVAYRELPDGIEVPQAAAISCHNSDESRERASNIGTQIRRAV